MTINLRPLKTNELKLLLSLLRLECWPKTVPIKPIRKVASSFQKYVKRNRMQIAPLLPELGRPESLCYPIQWVRDPEKVGLRPGIPKRQAQEHADGLTRDQWRRIKHELRRVLEESHKLAFWCFRLPVVLPSRKAFIDKPEMLILDWLTARLVANGQQFRFVSRCQYLHCGKAGLRKRARKQNLYCSEACKRKDIVEQRKNQRAKLRSDKKRRQEEFLAKVRSVVGSSTSGVRGSQSRVPIAPSPSVRRG